MGRFVRPSILRRSPAARVGDLPSALLLCGIAFLLSCGDDHKPSSPRTPVPPATGALTFTRADSTVIRMGDTIRICCGVWDPGFIDRNALKVVAYDPAGQRGGWKLFVLPDEAIPDSAYSLPTQQVGESSQSPVNLFVNDLARENEASSSASGARGTVLVHSFSCGPPVRIDVTIDAVLASELAGGSEVRVRGRFQAEVTPGYPCAFGY